MLSSRPWVYGKIELVLDREELVVAYYYCPPVGGLPDGCGPEVGVIQVTDTITKKDVLTTPIEDDWITEQILKRNRSV